MLAFLRIFDKTKAMRKTMRNEKTAILLLSSVMAGILAARPDMVMAQDLTVGNELVGPAAVSTYTLDINDQKPLDTLKQEVIKKYADSVSNMNMDDIDAASTNITVHDFDHTQPGLQNVNITLNVTAKSNEAVSLVYTENAYVEVETSGPHITVKEEEVTIDFGSSFNFTENIASLNTKNSALPALREEDNVDVNKEGTYDCTIEAVDAQGKVNTATYKVNVKKTPEQLRAEEEARIAAEKAAEQARQEAARQAEIQAAQAYVAAPAPVPAPQPVQAAPNPSGNAIVNFAMQFLGSPYVFGGNSPAGFDCSGFTQFVYGNFGIALPRTSYGQEGVGTIVSAAEAQPGDLVTYDGHAGIYIGNGQMINAMTPAQGVTICGIYDVYNGRMMIHRL